MTAQQIDRDRLRELAENATIPGFPGYMVRSDGTVWSTSTNWRGYGERQLRAVPGRDGYPKVRLNDPAGVRRNRYVHRLVAEAFLPEPLAGEQVRHLNGDKSDARAENLAWGSAADNAADRNRHGTTARGVRNGFAKLTDEQVREVRRLSSEGFSRKEIEVLTGIPRPNLGKMIRKESWAHVD